MIDGNDEQVVNVGKRKGISSKFPHKPQFKKEITLKKKALAGDNSL